MEISLRVIDALGDGARESMVRALQLSIISGTQHAMAGARKILRDSKYKPNLLFNSVGMPCFPPLDERIAFWTGALATAAM